MNKKRIDIAANQHALEQLGDEQFTNNREAAKAVTSDFKAGISWALKHQGKTVKKDWEDFWKEICLNEDGTINLEQIKRELSDFHGVLSEVSKVYENITRGAISKPNTQAKYVIAEVERIHQEELNELEKSQAEDE